MPFPVDVRTTSVIGFGLVEPRGLYGLLDRLVRIVLPVRAEQGARDAQRLLAEA